MHTIHINTYAVLYLVNINIRFLDNNVVVNCLFKDISHSMKIHLSHKNKFSTFLNKYVSVYTYTHISFKKNKRDISENVIFRKIFSLINGVYNK